MIRPEPMPTDEVDEHFAELIARVEYQRERIILTKHGRDVAMLVPIERKPKSGKR